MTRLKSILKILRILYLSGLVVLIVWVVRSEWPQVAELLAGARPALLLASLLASSGMILIGAWFWVTSLRIQGYQAPRRQVLNQAVSATSRSLLARYVPGSVWFAVGRVGLLRAAGMPIGPLSATAVLEMATSLTVVILSGLAVLGLSGVVPGGALWMVVMAVSLLAITSPATGGRLVRWLAARRGMDFSLGWRGYLQLMGINGVFWAWSALTFLLYLRAFPATDTYRTILVVGGFLLTWGIGFLAPFAPQGIGVFEMSMTTVLAADEVAGTAVVLGGYRLVLLARDLIATAIAESIATRRALGESARTGSPQAPEPPGGTSPDHR